MPTSAELARADRVLPGLWRLRLPLPWPGVPHVNAWAIAAGSGVVLVDTGLHEPGALGQLELALDQAGLRLEHVRLLVCTHAHSDHYGLAAPIVERGRLRAVDAPEPRAHDARRRRPRARARAADRGGPPERRAAEPLAALRGEARRGQASGIAEVVEPDRDLVPGVEVETDLGTWQVYETPGHAPSHVVPPPARARPAAVAATTCSAACRSTTTTARRPTRPASS